MEPNLNTPLLQRVHRPSPYSAIDMQHSEPTAPPPRLVSLDVFTGLCILGMVLSRELFERFPVLGHSPWDGLYFGDLLPAFFLFSLGAQIAHLESSGPRAAGLPHILSRFLQLLALGLFLDGGFFHAAGDLAFGVSLSDLRISGFLQRIAACLLIVGLCHVAVIQREARAEDGDCCSLCSVLIYHWQTAFLVTLGYLSLTFLLYVPSWEVPLPMELAPAGTIPFLQTRGILPGDGGTPWTGSNVSSLTVPCGTSGDLSPACNAAGYIDRSMLGINHLFRLPSFRNLPDCEQAFAAQGKEGVDTLSFPAWCLSPYEPAGVLSTLGSTLAAFLGLHFGHVLRRCDGHGVRLSHTTPLGVALVAGGWLLQYPFSLSLSDIVTVDNPPAWAQISSPGIPFNMNLFSTSFALFASGLACLLLSGIYLLVDYAQVQFYTRFLEWSGKSWLILYAAVVSPLLSTVLAGFYWEEPENNLVSALRWILGSALHDPDAALIVGAVLKVLACSMFAGFLCWQEVSFTI